MNRRILLVLSLAANLGWLVAFVWLQSPDPGTRTTAVTAPEEVAAVDAPGPVSTTEIPVEPPRIDAERWADLEHAELDLFKANLESVGCPPQTVYDILTAVMEQDYLRRRAASVEPFQQDTWHKLVRPLESRAQYAAAGEEVLKLWREFRNRQTELLGRRSPLDEQVERAVERRRIWLEHGDLPEEKIAQILALNLDRTADLAAVQTETDVRLEEGENGQAVATEFANRFRRILGGRVEAIENLLSEEERTEWRLRQNGAASWAARSVGFEPTQEELRAVANMIDEVKGTFPEGSRAAGGVDEEEGWFLRRDANLEIAERKRDLLGAERYAEFQRGHNALYQQLIAVSARFSLPQSSADATHAAFQEFSSQSRALPDSVPVGMAREQSMTELRLELEEAVRSALSEEVLEIFRQHAPDWPDGM